MKCTNVTSLISFSYVKNLLCYSLLPLPHPGVTLSLYAHAPLPSSDLFAPVPIFVGGVFSSPCLNVTPSSKTIQRVGERENERANAGEIEEGRRVGGGHS